MLNTIFNIQLVSTLRARMYSIQSMCTLSARHTTYNNCIIGVQYPYVWTPSSSGIMKAVLRCVFFFRLLLSMAQSFLFFYFPKKLAAGQTMSVQPTESLTAVVPAEHKVLRGWIEEWHIPSRVRRYVTRLLTRILKSSFPRLTSQQTL